MLEKAKKNDPKLYTTVVIMSCLIALGTIITSIVLWLIRKNSFSMVILIPTSLHFGMHR